MKKLNSIDIGLLLIAVCAIAIIVIKFSPLNEADVEKAKTQAAIVSMKLSGVRVYTVDGINVGDTIYADATNSKIGIIKNIETVDAVETINTNDGKAVEAKRPDRYDVTIEIESNMLERETAYLAEGITEIKVNSEMIIETVKITSTAKVTGIEMK